MCSAPVSVPTSRYHGLGERWTATLKQLDSRVENEKNQGDNNNSSAAAEDPKATSARKPTFLQMERWKAIQKARCNGMSLREIERELGIHRSTIRKYLDAEGPPNQLPRTAPTASASANIPA